MKKIISIILVSAFAVSLVGCGSKTSTDEYGNEVTSSKDAYEVNTEELPCTIPFGDVSVTLNSIDYYQNINNYEYTFYVVLRFDMSELSEDDRYWLEKEDTTIYVNVTNEENELDSDSLTYMGESDYDNEFVCGYFTGYTNSYRYSFAGSDINVKITMEEPGEDSMERVINYTGTVPDEVPATDEMDSVTEACYRDWLEIQIKSFS